MRTTGRILMAAVAAALLVGLVGRDARAGLFDDLKAKAKEEAKKKAMEMAKKKVSEMTGKKATAEPPKEPEDAFQGLYVGTLTAAGAPAGAAEAKVVGYLDKKKDEKHWDVVLEAKTLKAAIKLRGTPDGQKVKLTGGGLSGEIADGKLTAKGLLGSFELKQTVRKSPTLGAKPPTGAIVLLPFEEGKPTSLDELTNQNWVLCKDGSALVRRGSSRTKREFESFKVHIEFYCPYQPDRRGQGRANSGCYMHNRYEVQVLDSFGLEMRMGDCGAIYGVRIPSVNASLPPGTWQTYDITFDAPKLDAAGKVVSPAKFVEVLHNGVKIHENVPVGKITRAAGAKGIVRKGPIMLQDHGNPVRYRNIWLVER